MQVKKALDHMSVGVCYYPEQWPVELWEDDFRRMRELGITNVRVAEFAWSIFEPEEGVYSFELFDHALELAHKHGIQVILGTPTATPPAWLTTRYPEVLNATFEGVAIQHGLRRHYNYSSPKYRELSASITRKMAEHYKDHPAVVGWQIDNEFNCETKEFYAPADHIAFRGWLKAKYGTLHALNKAWGTVFWSQTYTDWDQVHLPRMTTGGRQPNPHLALDEKRFISDNVISYARIQADIIRETAPRHWVTTNGLFGGLDNHRMTGELLDFFSYDSYPQFSTLNHNPDEKDRLADRGWSQTLSVVRSISPRFCVMEQQAGPGGWVNRMDMPSPKPGQMRLWTYQSIAHGANMVVYFRWRTATFGQEMYWHGLNDYHNRENRRVREARWIGKEIAAISERAANTTYAADIAILRDYDNEWDGEYDVWHGPFAWTSGTAWFKALQYRHVPCDIRYINEQTTLAELQTYKTLVYPHPTIMTDKTAALLEQYAREGGILIFGCRTGYKDEKGHCYMRPFPGAAAGMCGISVEEFTMVKGSREPVSMHWQETGELAEAVTGADDFNDILHPESDSVEVVAAYNSDYYAGKPAVTRNRIGKGEVWYYGAVFNRSAAEQIIDRLGIASPVRDWLTLPQGVELAVREDANGPLYFLLNYGEEAAVARISKPMRNLLTDRQLQGEFEMEGFGVVILTEAL
ncbi:beta-galactosidase [Paenibacillus sp. HB172176]|uniref:beta-galactosidase n=1 Tax=Paenibacillus sp. HB172176 TaxID=2493690 RepID=UPI00143A5C2D|nr:beta-galactosidase [Paenibacillus sp. HB172176]